MRPFPIDTDERMFYTSGMETVAKLTLLAEQMHLEPAEEVNTHAGPGLLPAPGRGTPPPCGLPEQHGNLGITRAVMPGGKTIPLLKTLLTSACERDCYYCPFRAGRSYRRTTLQPAEMAQVFMDMHRAGMVEGLFLSSGIIKGGVATQDRLLATAEILRQQHQFNGYLHLKIMPGAERAQVERAMQLADRISVNLEAPNDRRLALLAPKKQFLTELLPPLQWAEAIRQAQPERPRPGRGTATAHLPAWKRNWASTVTQFVVGAVGESDLELLTTAAYLHQQLHLRRTYYSTFSPVPDTPLEHLPAGSPLREHRLYQSSFLLRDYGFDLEDMPFDPAGNLPLALDPKVAWAKANLAEQPVEVNRAGREELLRVPGIGPKGADAILAARRRGTLRQVKDLQAIGVVTTRLAPFVLLDGSRLGVLLPLFT